MPPLAPQIRVSGNQMPTADGREVRIIQIEGKEIIFGRRELNIFEGNLIREAFISFDKIDLEWIAE
jgi:hypothetical protein